MNSKTNRLAWIDYISAIGTVMVFMQHSCVPKITRIILAFHMPLFFWISGYLYRVRENDGQDVGKYLVSKTKRLLIPYFFWFTVSHLIAAIRGAGITSESFIRELLYCPSWFLPCLFISESIVHIIFRKMRSAGTYSYLLAILFWVASWVENQIAPARSVFCLDTSLMAIGFIFTGYASAGLLERLFSLSTAKKWISAVFLAGGGTVCVLLNGSEDVNFMMFQNQYGNYFYAIAGALLLIAMLILAVELMEPILPKRYLNWVRSNGLLLFVIHQSIIGMVGDLIPSIKSQPLMFSSIVYLIAIHIVSWPCCWLVNRYIPWAAGKKMPKRITD